MQKALARSCIAILLHRQQPRTQVWCLLNLHCCLNTCQGALFIGSHKLSLLTKHSITSHARCADHRCSRLSICRQHQKEDCVCMSAGHGAVREALVRARQDRQWCRHQCILRSSPGMAVQLTKHAACSIGVCLSVLTCTSLHKSGNVDRHVSAHPSSCNTCSRALAKQRVAWQLQLYNSLGAPSNAALSAELQDATGNAADIAVGWAIGVGAPFAFGELACSPCHQRASR